MAAKRKKAIYHREAQGVIYHPQAGLEGATRPYRYRVEGVKRKKAILRPFMAHLWVPSWNQVSAARSVCTSSSLSKPRLSRELFISRSSSSIIGSSGCS